MVNIFQLPRIHLRRIAEFSIPGRSVRHSMLTASQDLSPNGTRGLRDSLSVKCLAEQVRQAAQVMRQGGELVRQQRLRAVGQGFFRAAMHFDVDAVGPGRDGSAGPSTGSGRAGRSHGSDRR